MTAQNYARLSAENTVIETWQPPENLAYLTPAMIFVPWLAVEFVPCPDEVRAAWIYDPVAKTFSAPPPPVEGS